MRLPRRPRRRGPQTDGGAAEPFDLGEPAPLWAARVFARRGWSADRLAATFGITAEQANDVIEQTRVRPGGESDS